MTTRGSAKARKAPVFSDIPASVCRSLIERNHVGRIAYSFHDRVDVQPIHYMFSENWIYGRTSRGGKFSTIAHNPWCAFEVDEVRDLFDWDSVVVKGQVEFLDPEMASPDAYARGLELMRLLVPDTFEVLDPVPNRSILFRMHASEISGRSARPSAQRDDDAGDPR